ncbi:MAG: cytochrome b562 [Verrucomicrobiales bacterium]
MKKLFVTALTLGFFAVLPATADDTPLAEQMDVLNDAYKAIRRTDDAAEGAKLAREAQLAVIKGITMTPSYVEKGGHPEGKEKAMVSYRKQMAELIVVLCDVEAAFLADDFDKVKELVTPLKESKKKGHGEFIEE